MLRIEGYRNAPGEGSTGYAQILKTREQEVVHHLILSRYRLNELRMLVDISNQAICVLAHLEEVCLFLCRLYLASTVRALAVYKLRRSPERLTRSTVHALVVALVNITLIIELLKNLLYLLLVILIRCADKFVIGGVHQIPDCLDLSCHLVYELLWRNAFCFRFQLDFLTVLVRTGLEPYIVALSPLITGNAVRQHNLVGIADMRLTGCVGDGSCDIIWFLTITILILTHEPFSSKYIN